MFFPTKLLKISDILGHPLQEGEAAKLSDDSDASPIKKAAIWVPHCDSEHGNPPGNDHISHLWKFGKSSSRNGRCRGYVIVPRKCTLALPKSWKLVRKISFLKNFGVIFTLPWFWEKGYLLLHLYKLYPFVILK